LAPEVVPMTIVFDESTGRFRVVEDVPSAYELSPSGAIRPNANERAANAIAAAADRARLEARRSAGASDAKRDREWGRFIQRMAEAEERSEE
jgi:hypothetical protein